MTSTTHNKYDQIMRIVEVEGFSIDQLESLLHKDFINRAHNLYSFFIRNIALPSLDIKDKQYLVWRFVCSTQPSINLLREQCLALQTNEWVEGLPPEVLKKKKVQKIILRNIEKDEKAKESLWQVYTTQGIDEWLSKWKDLYFSQPDFAVEEGQAA